MKKNRFYIQYPTSTLYLPKTYQTLTEAVIKVKGLMKKFPSITSMRIIVNGKIIATIPDSTRKG